ncbi:hypothetical protein GWI33_008420 [Rhynchophorus ferrugineus]|uniref:Uncharacterized protein n=1 Tax=Rhynchophorus ferrugineus TaxID=354439 RepID=A0A834ME73_RHYFE|nr:hypothetical protein GWI33_008420 [Rhynchophorus ferrugineus]
MIINWHLFLDARNCAISTRSYFNPLSVQKNQRNNESMTGESSPGEGDVNPERGESVCDDSWGDEVGHAITNYTTSETDRATILNGKERQRTLAPSGGEGGRGHFHGEAIQKNGYAPGFGFNY